MTLMMFILIFLLAISVFLLIVELFFIPGTTIFGILGGVGAAVAIYFSFQESTNFGYVSVILGLIIFVVLFFIGRNMMKNSKFNLPTEIDSKVNTYNDGLVNVGDIGKTITVLKPNGKALIDNKKIEVYSIGNYIDKDIDVSVIKIEENKIFVNPLK